MWCSAHMKQNEFQSEQADEFESEQAYVQQAIMLMSAMRTIAQLTLVRNVFRSVYKGEDVAHIVNHLAEINKNKLLR